MLKLYYGTNRQAARDAVNAFVQTNLAPDGTLTTIDPLSYSDGQLAEALGASSLFGGAEWFLIDTPAADDDVLAEVYDNLAEMSESQNTFLILEGALLAPAKKKYRKHTDSDEEFTAVAGQRFNNFAMADALASKDRRNLWVLLQTAKSEGMAAEFIIGTLWWQLKTLRLASVTNNADEAGMKEYPYNKAKRSLAAFAPGEVQRLSQSLLELYHDGHAGVQDIDLALERWVLGGR